MPLARSIMGVVVLGGWVAAATPACAWDPGYQLNLTGEHLVFSATLNGLPVIPERTEMAGTILYLAPLERPGGNELVVTVERRGAWGSGAATLVGPSADPSGYGESPRLAVYECGADASPDRPQCEMQHVMTAQFNVPNAPKLLLWQAEPAPLDDRAQSDITSSLDNLVESLRIAGGSSSWQDLYFLDAVRRTDYQTIWGRCSPDCSAAVQALQGAAKTAPGRLNGPDRVGPKDLIFSTLPDHLVLVQRHDGKPLISMKVGSAPEMDNLVQIGDVADRFMSGQVVRSNAIFGKYSGKWELVR